MNVPLERYLKDNFGIDLAEARDLALKESFFMSKAIAGFTRLTEVHQDACNFLDDQETQYKAIIQPRGTAKSSTIKGKLLQHIARDPNVRILYVSKTQDRAAQGVKDMRDRILGNGCPLYPRLFPELVPDNLRDGRWTASAFQVKRTKSWDEATVESAGIGTNKVGFHYDIIFFDDPLAPSKDDIHAEDIYFGADIIQKTVGYMQLAAIGNLDPGSKLRLIYFAGTRYSINDAVSWMKKHWKQMEFFERPVFGPDGHTQFPTFWSDAQIEMEKKAQGTFFFKSQMENDPVDPASKVFSVRLINEYMQSPPRKDGFLTITVDPAGGVRGSGKSKTAITGVLSSSTGGVYVLDYKCDFIDPRRTVSETLAMAKRLDPDIVGFEKVGYQAALEPYLREAMRIEKMRFNIEAITRDRQSKDSRLIKIQPILENGDLYIKPWMTELVKQLDEFPYGDKDLLDTLADHISLTLKFSGRLMFQLKNFGIRDAIIEEQEIPAAGEPFVCVFLEKDDYGMAGFVLRALKVMDKLYITEASGIGHIDGSWADAIVQLPSDIPIITTPDVADTFLKGCKNKIIKRKMRTQFPEQEAMQSITSGNVVLTSGSQALTGSVSEVGLRALALLVENSKKHQLKAVLV